MAAHEHAVTFEDFVDAIVPLACCHRRDGSRGFNCWVEACELLSKFKHKWNRPTSTQRAHHRKLLHRLMQYCISQTDYNMDGLLLIPIRLLSLIASDLAWAISAKLLGRKRRLLHMP